MRNTRKPPLTVVGVGRLMRCWAAWGVALAVIGCQQTPTTVKGQVTLDGKPLSIGKGMRGTVVFQPTVASGTTLTGLIDANGRYELAAGGRVDVTPSTYLVTVSASELVPATEDQPATGRLVTPAKYASATESGFRIEIFPGENEVNLPLVSESEPPATVEAVLSPEAVTAEPPDVDPSEASAPAAK